MLRQIITPLEPTFTIEPPTSMVGKTVEIIAFELNEAQRGSPTDDTATSSRVAAIRAITKGSLVDLSNYKFDRDQANDFSE